MLLNQDNFDDALERNELTVIEFIKAICFPFFSRFSLSDAKLLLRVCRVPEKPRRGLKRCLRAEILCLESRQDLDASTARRIPHFAMSSLLRFGE
jgi:hypothetical protein